MGYNLGNFSDQLSADDYNKALAASGSDYQVQQAPAADMSGSGYATAAQAAPAADMSGSGYASAAGTGSSHDASGLAPQTPSVAQSQYHQGESKAARTAGLVGGILGQNSNNNLLGGVLGTVAKFL